jgi:hypothetical protein
MDSRADEMQFARAVTVTDDTLQVDLADGRTISVPLAWYPRLLHGTAKERNNWRLIGEGKGIHWYDLDETISVENIIRGKASVEGQHSFRRWLRQRVSWREQRGWSKEDL